MTETVLTKTVAKFANNTRKILFLQMVNLDLFKMLNREEKIIVLNIFSIGSDSLSLASLASKLNLKSPQIYRYRDKAMRKLNLHLYFNL